MIIGDKNIDVRFPPKLAPLFLPYRYKVVYGGRGGGRSWGCARALLIKGLKNKLRILCAREIQKSIKDSVLKLLADQIELLDLQSKYQVFETVIRGSNGTEITFSGLAQHTVDSVKSMEGVDIVWCEEAQTISKRSWDILIPTIRKDDSEIWITFNPDLETDPTYQRFVVHPPEHSAVIELSYIDNPWFTNVMELERVHCKETDPDNYPNIWEGACRPAAEGAIYYKEIESAKVQNRICNVPYDPMLRVHVVFDIGWNDKMAISLIQRNSSEIRVIEYIEDSHKTLDYYSALLKEKRYNWGTVYLPHDGYSGDVKTGKSCADIMRKLGWKVPRRNEIAEYGVEEGIRISRMTFPRVYFDKVNAGELVERLKRYKRQVNRQTMSAGKPLHDDNSHGGDNFRYVCINADLMSNEDEAPQVYYTPTYAALDPGVGF